MSETLWITLIIAVVVLVVLFMFRKQLQSFLFKANREGIQAELNTRDPRPQGRAQVNITGNRQAGKDNAIDVGRSGVNVQDNKQRGSNNKITVTPDKTRKQNKQK